MSHRQSTRVSILALMLLWLGTTPVVRAQEAVDIEDDPPAVESVTADEPEEEIPEEDVDDTPEVETENTIDDAVEKRGFSSDGDLRPIYDYLDRDSRDGSSEVTDAAGFRLRIGATFGITKYARVGARVAGRCFVDDCDLEFVTESATPVTNGLANGQFTFDELYVHWYRVERFNVALGRLQTRYVLRGGVYAKSLDRNDSNNVNVTWTDGAQVSFKSYAGWSSQLVVQLNDEEGTGSIRRGPLDFDDSAAHQTYFIGTENTRGRGPVAQRAFDVSYLPSSLLKDGDPDGRRVDYWGLVGRLAFRWPQRTDGPRIRAGLEVGYAPETPTGAAVDLDEPGDVDGLAWDVVLSAMDFVPGHSIGINYAQTGAGWFLSPQFRPNEELLEIRWQWRSKKFPLLEVRVRRREEIDQLVDAIQKREEFDGYARLTWQFDFKKL